MLFTIKVQARFGLNSNITLSPLSLSLSGAPSLEDVHSELGNLAAVSRQILLRGIHVEVLRMEFLAAAQYFEQMRKLAL